ncbi:hypothetical protein OC834_001793 [Tilletia horrida]|nr:hypothetical protein OC834_001793 [Tilletia horrida]
MAMAAPAGTSAVVSDTVPAIALRHTSAKQQQQQSSSSRSSRHTGGSQNQRDTAAAAPSKDKDKDKDKERDIASAVINYQRKQSRAAAGKDAVADNHSAAGGGTSHSRSRGGKGRHRSGASSDRGSTGGGDNKDSATATATATAPPSLRIIQHGPGSVSSAGGHSAGRLQPQRLTQRDLEALAETNESAGDNGHHADDDDPAPEGAIAQQPGSGSAAAGSSTITSLGAGGTLDQAPQNNTRTLFDPRRHDPVKFAMSKRLPGIISLSQSQSLAGSSVTSSIMDGASASAAPSISTGGSPSVTSSEASRERRRRRAPSSRSNPTGAGGSESGAGSEAGAGAGAAHVRPGESAASGGPEGNAYVNEIKRMYKVITTLETQLKEQHAAAAACGSSVGLLPASRAGAAAAVAAAAGVSGAGAPASDGGKAVGIAQRNSSAATSASSSIASLDPTAPGANSPSSVKPVVDDGVDHAFWNALAAQHKNLAEHHAAFMEMAWRPNLPASFAALPQNYNTSARLWQTAFHLFLERIRHALPYPSPSSPPPPGDRRGAARQAALLDHLEEFIYFAYAYYSNLHEAETFVRLRTAWIESLGDLARYRMAVAGFRMGLAAWEAREKEVARERERAVAREAPDSPPFGPQRHSVAGLAPASRPRGEDEEEDLVGDEADSADEVGSHSHSHSYSHSHSRPRARAARGTRQTREGMEAARKMAARRGFEAPSIGEAALGDWELEEKETWRETARGWYAKGLAEIPGTGRLHHHLGILSRGKEELKGLYHFAKSLTTSHPYPPARETMLPMCDREHQVRRLQPGASASDLFIHLHAMLFTRVDLDNFEDVFARYKEAIKTALLASGHAAAAAAAAASESVPSSSSRAAGGRLLHGGGMDALRIDDAAAERAAAARAVSPHSDASEAFGEGVIPDAGWMIFGTVCIAALLQYGLPDALLAAPPTTSSSLASTTAPNTDSRREAPTSRPPKGKITQKVKSHTPTAIMLNKDSAATSGASSSRSPLRSNVALPSQDEEGEAVDGGDGQGLSPEGDLDQEGEDDVDPQSLLQQQQQQSNIVSLQQPAFDPSSIPLTFGYAARVAFDTLEIVIRDGVLGASHSGSGLGPGPGPQRHGTADAAPAPASSTTPNPFITMMLTFLLTIVKQPNALLILERWVPWQALTDLANNGSGSGGSSGGGGGSAGASSDARGTGIIPPANALAEIPSKVTGGMPLPEDWCLRGMSWVSRRVFERGFWKPKPAGSEWGASGLPSFESEIDVLDRGEQAGGLFLAHADERDSEEGHGGPVVGGGTCSSGSGVGVVPPKGAGTAAGAVAGAAAAGGADPLAQLRWCRIGYAIGSLARTVPGLDARQSRKHGGRNALVIVAPLATKMADWEAEERALRLVEESQRGGALREEEDDDDEGEEEHGEGWDEESEAGLSSDGEEDASLSEAVRALKARRRALKKALKDAQKNPASLLRPRLPRRASKQNQRGKAAPSAVSAAAPKSKPSAAAALDALPGYTILVLDTNIIVSPAGNLLRALVESKKWTVVLPLAVITELDGLSKNRSQVGEGAKEALRYIEDSLRTHSKWLKIQTSRGNYLHNLNIRFEHFDFAGLHMQNDDSASGPASEQQQQQRKTLQARNLDEIILRAAVWQEEHFVNRIPILFAEAGAAAAEREAALARVTPKTAKVVLITLDRNLRLKARARGVKAASDVELLDVVVGP